MKKKWQHILENHKFPYSQTSKSGQVTGPPVPLQLQNESFDDILTYQCHNSS